MDEKVRSHVEGASIQEERWTKSPTIARGLGELIVLALIRLKPVISTVGRWPDKSNPRRCDDSQYTTCMAFSRCSQFGATFSSRFCVTVK